MTLIKIFFISIFLSMACHFSYLCGTGAGKVKAGAVVIWNKDVTIYLDKYSPDDTLFLPANMPLGLSEGINTIYIK